MRSCVRTLRPLHHPLPSSPSEGKPDESERRQSQDSPGVPQVVVRAEKVDSSIILDRPKSAIRRSESSSLVRKSRFSGLRSAVVVKGSAAVGREREIQIGQLPVAEQARETGDCDRCVPQLRSGPTSVHNAMIMQVSDGTRDGIDQLGGVVLVEELFRADAVEQLATLAEVRHEVDCCNKRVSFRLSGSREETDGCSESRSNLFGERSARAARR